MAKGGSSLLPASQEPGTSLSYDGRASNGLLSSDHRKGEKVGRNAPRDVDGHKSQRGSGYSTRGHARGTTRMARNRKRQAFDEKTAHDNRPPKALPHDHLSTANPNDASEPCCAGELHSSIEPNHERRELLQGPGKEQALAAGQAPAVLGNGSVVAQVGAAKRQESNGVDRQQTSRRQQNRGSRLALGGKATGVGTMQFSSRTWHSHGGWVESDEKLPTPLSTAEVFASASVQAGCATGVGAELVQRSAWNIREDSSGQRSNNRRVDKEYSARHDSSYGRERLGKGKSASVHVRETRPRVSEPGLNGLHLSGESQGLAADGQLVTSDHVGSDVHHYGNSSSVVVGRSNKVPSPVGNSGYWGGRQSEAYLHTRAGGGSRWLDNRAQTRAHTTDTDGMQNLTPRGTSSSTMTGTKQHIPTPSRSSGRWADARAREWRSSNPLENWNAPDGGWSQQIVASEASRADAPLRHGVHPSKVSLESQREMLIDQLCLGNFECMICCYMVRADSAVWNCPSCFHIMHLHCVKKWAATVATADSGYSWRCPACQHCLAEAPAQYWCFCGRTRNPPVSQNDTPHSCGKLCSRKRGGACTHACNLICQADAVNLCSPARLAV